MSTTEPTPTGGPQLAGEELAAGPDPVLLGGNELVADTFGEYLQAQWRRIRAGESGILPVIVGLIAIVIFFQAKDGKFLSGGNLVNLIDQNAFLIALGMGEIFMLLLGEIDLSLGYNMGVGAIVAAELAAPPHNVSWILAILAGVATCAVITMTAGLLVTLLRLPSFIVTLAYLLGLQGVIQTLLNHDTHASGGSIGVSNNVLNDVANGSLSPTAGWIVMVVVVVLFAALSLFRDQRRRSSGLVTPPLTLTLIKIAAAAIAGVVIVVVCNSNRGNFTVIKGVPWAIPIILVLVASVTFLLNRTRYGRYMYAIGGNAEAARRAGISLFRIKLTAFILAGVMAGVAAVLYMSQLGSISSNVNGGTYVLYGVAAAVIGGTSLFGGRGKMIHAVLGGVIIGAIANGMALIGLSSAAQFMVNAVVLLAAVTVDALARRGRTAT